MTTHTTTQCRSRFAARKRLAAFAVLASFASPEAFAAAPFDLDPNGQFLDLYNTNNVRSWRYNDFGFRATLLNVVNPDTGTLGVETLSGERITAAGSNPRTNKVAVGVLMRFFAESDFSTVWVLDRRNGNRTLVQLPNSGKPAPLAGQSYALGGITAISYSPEGYLQVFTADASGARGRIRFNPNLTYKDCVVTTIGEGNPCAGLP